MRASSIAGVGVSVTALAVLFTGTALGLDRRLEAWLADPASAEVEVVPEESPEPAAASAPAALPPEPAPPPIAPPPIAPPPIAPPPIAVEEPAREAELVEVPDVGGIAVSRAWRTFRERGLRLVVRDADGLTIPREDASLYRVRAETMEPAPGTSVAPGTTVRARARDAIPRAFSGY